MATWDRFPGASSTSYSAPKRQHVVRGTRNGGAEFTELFFFETFSAPKEAGGGHALRPGNSVTWRQLNANDETVLEGFGAWNFVDTSTKKRVQIAIYDKTKRALKHFDEEARFDPTTGKVALDDFVKGDDLEVDAIEPNRR